MKCMGCGHDSTFWCDNCESRYRQAIVAVHAVVQFMGTDYDEGSYVYAALRLLEENLTLSLTTVGRAATLKRADSLLATVEDFFTHTPMCLVCGEHRMTLVAGDRPAVTCTGGCQYE